MPAQRVKGQEVLILVVRDGALEAELTDIQNFNTEIMLEQIEQGYLGEKTNRHDEFFKGVKGDFEMNHHSQDFLAFVSAVLDRAKRNTPDVVINISAVLAFPNGQTPTVIFPDVKFGPVPVNIPGRGEYLKTKFDFVCDDFTIQLA